MSIGASLYRSVDWGASRQRLVNAVHILKMIVSPDFPADRRIYLLADHHVSRFDDAGETWTNAPIWDFTNPAQVMALSPNFTSNHTVYAAGANVYRSLNAGDTWLQATSPPPIGAASDRPWQPRRFVVGGDETLYLSIARYDLTPPYRRHDQLWISRNQGDAWNQLPAAPDKPAADLVVNLTDSALYLSVFNDNPFDEFDIPP